MAYFCRWRFLALGLWLLSCIFLPWVLEFLSLIPEGAAFIPRVLIVFSGLPILVNKLSFRVGLFIVLLSATLHLYRPEFLHHLVQGVDFRLRDAFFQARGPTKPTGDVVIVDIDQKSLEEVGQWPWPRTLVAEMIRKLDADGARVVGFDIVFAESDRFSLKNWAAKLSQVGLGMQLPGISPEESQVRLVDETWELKVDGKTVKQMVLQEWRRNMEREDPEFWIDPSLPENVKEQLITQQYLTTERRSWEEEVALAKKRAEYAGVEFAEHAFEAPEDPIRAMYNNSQGLFFLGANQPGQDLLTDGASLITDNDWELAKAMREARVVAGGLFITATTAGARLEAYRESEAKAESEGLVLSSAINNVDAVFPHARQALEQVLNVPTVQQMIYHQGMFNVVPDRSGAARFYTLLMKAPVYQTSLVLKPGLESLQGADRLNPDNYESKISEELVTYPSIALEMLRVANGYDVLEPGYKGGQRGIWLRRDRGFRYEEGEEKSWVSFGGLLPAERFIPADYKADTQINYLGYGGRWQPEYEFGEEHYFKYYSISDVLYGRFENGTFKDKYVLIGSTDPTLSDLVGSPYRAAFPGLEVHATMLDNMIAENYLVGDGQWAATVGFIAILIGGTILSFVVAYAEVWLAGLATFAVLTLLPTLAFLGFAYSGVVVDIVYLWLSSGTVAITVILVNFFVENADRRFVVGQFARMVSPDVLKKLRDDAGEVSLGGQRSSVSVMFSDVAGFTTISEQLAPEKLVCLLNDYLTPMSEIIMKHNGFIDKYIGDAIMAAWGVPYPDPKHAEAACLAVIEQCEKIQQLRGPLKEEYGVDIQVRLGISSGYVSAALMGSESRKSYTVMGDVVNLGARLEPACKDYGINILICEKTYEMAREKVVARCVDLLVVKGKTVPIPVFELVGRRGELSEEKEKLLFQFDRALKAHWKRNWEEALFALEEVFAIDPEDGPGRNLQKRIENYKLQPPPESWQGEFVKTSK